MSDPNHSLATDNAKKGHQGLQLYGFIFDADNEPRASALHKHKWLLRVEAV